MVVDSVEYDFHLLPSGVLNKKAVSFIGTLQQTCFLSFKIHLCFSAKKKAHRTWGRKVKAWGSVFMAPIIVKNICTVSLMPLGLGLTAAKKNYVLQFITTFHKFIKNLVGLCRLEFYH